MTDLLRLVTELAAHLFPFRLVHQHESGLYFLAGRCLAVVPPGLYFVVPWFTDVTGVSMVPHVFQTPLQTINDLSFSASVVVRVTGPWKAHNTLELWHESAVELCSAGLPAAVRSGHGDDLAAVRRDVNRELRPHGVRLIRLRYLDYVRGAPTLRLLNSQENR